MTAEEAVNAPSDLVSVTARSPEVQTVVALKKAKGLLSDGCKLAEKAISSAAWSKEVTPSMTYCCPTREKIPELVTPPASFSRS
eukprot:CAMPEP_0182460338 /NCGR_PEP_ID=MMETSP1319-20130603/5236_1 /TAXON_ID=172717 /ORGANISM="Bolidomonas pacifica, Strain RCC208" /LENGTH=83 /DNA_ID=CAMNT_0024659421 /DNA_START=204 /DNA_END=455 /DNA_ORIENTATION=+